MKKIKESKKLFLFIFLALIIIVFSLLILQIKSRESQREKQLVVLGTSDAKAQSYQSSSLPKVQEDDYLLGSSKAPLKMFVYEDNANIFSAQLAKTLDRLLVEYEDDLAIIVRPFVPRNSPLSQAAAVAIICAGEEDSWKEMRALLFAQVENANLSFTAPEKYASQLKLDEKEFLACLTNQTKSAKIEELTAAAKSYSVTGAPTIFIGDEMILGARPYDDYIDSNGDKIEGLKTVILKKLKK